MGFAPLFHSVPGSGLADSTFGALMGGATTSVTSSDSEITFSKAGTLSLLAVNNLGGTNTHTATVQANATPGALTVSFTGTGFSEDTTHSQSIAADDEANVKYTDTGTSPTYAWLRTVFSASSGHWYPMFAARAAGVIMDQTSSRYLPVTGSITPDGFSTIAVAEVRMKTAGEVSLLQINATVNAAVSSRTFTVYKNGSATGVTVTFSAGETGIKVSSSSAVSYVADDLLAVHIEALTATDDITITTVGVWCQSTGGAYTDVFGGYSASGADITRAASATANYTGPGGQMTALTETTAANKEWRFGFAGTLTNPRVYLSANSYASDGTMRIMNTTDGTSLTVTLTAGGGAGWYLQDTGSISFDASDVFVMEWDEGGASGSITVDAVGYTVLDGSAGGDTLMGQACL